MSYLDQYRLGQAIRDKRHQSKVKLRQAAKATGISASTLSRVENGKGYELGVDTFLCLCDWLGLAPASFITSEAIVDASALSPLQKVEWRLRDCPEQAELCRAMAEVLRLVRETNASGGIIRAEIQMGDVPSAAPGWLGDHGGPGCDPVDG